MTTLIDLGKGKQITLSHDLQQTWLSLSANRGSLGVEIDRKSAIKLTAALLAIIDAGK